MRIVRAKRRNQSDIVEAWSIKAIRHVLPVYRRAVEADVAGQPSASLWEDYQRSLERAYVLVYMLGSVWAWRQVPKRDREKVFHAFHGTSETASVAQKTTFAQSVTIEAGWGLPYNDALDAFKDKVPEADSLISEVRRLAEYRAKVSAAQEQANAAKSISRLIQSKLEPYTKAVDPVAIARVEVLKSLLGEEATVGRLQTEYRTTLMEAFNGGSAAQFQRTKLYIPVLMYRSHRDIRTRGNPQGLYPEPDRHWQFNGFCAPTDDPIWDTVTPPCGFCCRCVVVGVSRAECKQRGWIMPNGELNTPLIRQQFEAQRRLVTEGRIPDPGFRA